MNYDAETYSKVNGGQTQDSQEMLDRIKEAGIERAPIILDVGCGSGNVTALLARTIPHDRLISLDIESDMVDLARKTNAGSNIEFLVQDVSAPWEELDKTIQALEGQVDLVWSNHVLHWVPVAKRAQAVQNLLRLLKKGGSLYVNITAVPNFNGLLPAEEREANEKLIKIPSFPELGESWKSFFADGGFSDVSVKFVPKYWPYADKEQFALCANGVHILKSYLTEAVPEDQKDAVLQDFVDLYLRGLATPFGKPLVDSWDGATVEYFGQYQLSGRKNN